MPKKPPAKKEPTTRPVAPPTRTINPLHMEDLDPRRFEDLVRQLVHRFRPWRLIEPTGRLGADEGIDIRAEEASAATVAPASEETEGGEDEELVAAEEIREWRVQCKRYKQLHPKALVAIVDDLVPDAKYPPHGVLVAAAADVSAKALSAFHARALELGVTEHHFWSRSAIEDRLYLPENDHLLFAYFGISIQARRRSVGATIRSGVTLKKQLRSLLEKKGDESSEHERTYLLLRDPADTRYPREPKKGEPPKGWMVVRYGSLRNPGQLFVIVRERPAWLTPDRTGWDALFTDDLIAWDAENHLRGLHAWSVDERSERGKHRPKHDFWAEYVPEQDKAWLKVARTVPLERIIAVDPIGDGYFPILQVFVDFHPKEGPFGPGASVWLEGTARWQAPREQIDLRPSESNRVRLFPDPLPSTPYPAPPGLDHGKYPASTTLSTEAQSRLDEFLAQAAANGQERTGGFPAEDTSAAADREARRTRFVAWRETVGVPTLSAVAERLRAAGEQARVVVRSSPASVGTELSELVELRFKLRRESAFFSPDGHVRISWTPYRGLEMDIAPMADASTSGRSYAPPAAAPAKLTLEGLTQDHLEKQVLEAMRRATTAR